MQVTHYKQDCPQNYVTVQMDTNELHDIRMAVKFAVARDGAFDEFLRNIGKDTKNRVKNFPEFIERTQ